MTFSIVVRGATGRDFGVAVASKFLSVGAYVPAASVDAGAIATQAAANLAYRPEGLTLLGAGASAAQAVATLTEADPGRAHRQLGIVDKAGSSESYTGEECNAWAGGRSGPGYAIQGNILTGPEVVAEMERAWLASDPAAALGRRLLGALEAGDRAGGDRRGRQSAAVLVVAPGAGFGGGNDVAVDLRVDDHPEPVVELSRLMDLHALYFSHADPSTLLPLRDGLLGDVSERLRELGYPPTAKDQAAVIIALERWAGVENLEERLAGSMIDPVVLELLFGRSD